MMFIFRNCSQIYVTIDLRVHMIGFNVDNLHPRQARRRKISHYKFYFDLDGMRGAIGHYYRLPVKHPEVSSVMMYHRNL